MDDLHHAGDTVLVGLVSDIEDPTSDDDPRARAALSAATTQAITHGGTNTINTLNV